MFGCVVDCHQKLKNKEDKTSCADKFETLQDKDYYVVVQLVYSVCTRSLGHYYYVVVDQI